MIFIPSENILLNVHSHLSCPPPLSPPIPSTFSPGLLAALLDLPAADSSQGEEQHQQTHSQANSYPQSHRGECDVLTWSRGQRERQWGGGGGGGERERLVIQTCRAKIRAQLSSLYLSPLFQHLTTLLFLVCCHKKTELSRLLNTDWWHWWWSLPSPSPSALPHSTPYWAYPLQTFCFM